ncbi:uncharacterized protein LOC144157741 [Haemaphysalis longicornis]
MRGLLGIVSGTFCVLSLALCTAESETKDELGHGIVDLKKVYAAFPSLFAIFDQDEDGDLDCVATERTAYDVETPDTATYVWFLQGGNGHEKKNITYHLKPGPTTNVALYTIDDDETTQYYLRVPYSDYKNCLILEIPYKHYDECMLWVSSEAKENIPQTCLDMFYELCDEGGAAYSPDMCQEGIDL